MIRVEDRELSSEELDGLSLIVLDATINIIQDFKVIDKKKVERPGRVVGLLECPNRNCISVTDEAVESQFDGLERVFAVDTARPSFA